MLVCIRVGVYESVCMHVIVSVSVRMCVHACSCTSMPLYVSVSMCVCVPACVLSEVGKKYGAAGVGLAEL